MIALPDPCGLREHAVKMSSHDHADAAAVMFLQHIMSYWLFCSAHHRHDHLGHRSTNRCQTLSGRRRGGSAARRTPTDTAAASAWPATGHRYPQLKNGDEQTSPARCSSRPLPTITRKIPAASPPRDEEAQTRSTETIPPAGCARTEGLCSKTTRGMVTPVRRCNLRDEDGRPPPPPSL